MSLAPGSKLGPYEIVALIGAGGMGEVYRARDPRMGRDVAIKVAAERFNERFDREVHAVAALNHPNICHLYDVGPDYLVMELVEGPTLAERIKQGAVPLDEALKIGRQITEALEAAHDKGIVHRDLKPANVKIRPDGTVKVLDFGLAKVTETAEGDGRTEHSPTLTLDAATRLGVILGTAAYMAPEQARGKPVDKRADIWAFGVVLYEMLAGRRLFDGEDISEILAKVIQAEPRWDGIPAKVQRLLKKCLEKDPMRRLRDIGDVWELTEEHAALSAAANQGAGRLVWPAVAATLAVVLGALTFIHFREQPPAAELMRFQIPPPEKVTVGNQLSLSPDGHRLAFIARGAEGVVQIWVRSLDTLDARPVSGTEGADGPFWSPDSRFIGFAVSGKLKKVEVSGGPAQSVCDLPGPFLGGAWAPDGTIVFGGGFPMMRVPETGGMPVPILALDPARKELFQGNPSFLPDGRHFVYGRGSLEAGGIYLGSLDATPKQQDSKPLVTSQAPTTEYARGPDPDFGYVLFEQEGSLMALPFNARRLEPAGAAVPIAQSIASTNIGGRSYSASATGVLAVHTGRPGGTDRQLLWFDRAGKQLSQIGPPGPYNDIQLSPDGKLLVVDQGRHLWVADLARGVFSRLTPGDAQDYSGAAVSPDGRVAFTYSPGGALGDIYVKLASGASAPELQVKSATIKHPNNWSLDGRFFIYDDHTAQQQDLWVVPMSGDRKPIPFLVTPADETFGQFSPDTKWIAYSSDESGRREVYVQGFVPDHVPAAGIGKWQISAAGGDKPRWRRDGKELYYIAPDGKMMAVPVKSTATTFELGAAVPLFETHVTGFFPYDVAADGRFLLNTVKEDAAASASPITVVLNWTSGLKK
jgi:eukaryotic-like serine/threonine-protein kinase